MTIRVVEVLECDLHGEGDAYGHTITLDGETFTVDLCESGYQELTADLAAYLSAARRVKGDTGKPTTRRPPSNMPYRRFTGPPVAVPAAVVRVWWKRHPEGLPPFGANGPLPAGVKAAYLASVKAAT